MKYYCFYIDCDNAITKATIIMTENCDKVNAVKVVLESLGYDCTVVNSIDDFMEYAKDKTSQIKLLIL